jgi:hypothetical protein
VAGYSGTPLAAKLGVRAGTAVLAVEAPADYRDLLAPVPAGVRFGSRLTDRIDLIHVFSTSRARLATFLVRARKQMRDDASIWVSWPKKASGVPTDLTEDVVREIALPLGLVDIKVCAVDATWSGLKLVVRREQRRIDRARR